MILKSNNYAADDWASPSSGHSIGHYGCTALATPVATPIRLSMSAYDPCTTTCNSTSSGLLAPAYAGCYTADGTRAVTKT